MRSYALSYLSAVSVFIVIIFHASSVFADDVAGTMDNHIVPKVSGQISVDALLDESFWNYALILELKYEVQPGENIPAPVRTEVLLAYSESHFYAAFRAYDPCLACATHSLPGEMPLQVLVKDKDGNVLHEESRL